MVLDREHYGMDEVGVIGERNTSTCYRLLLNAGRVCVCDVCVRGVSACARPRLCVCVLLLRILVMIVSRVLMNNAHLCSLSVVSVVSHHHSSFVIHHSPFTIHTIHHHSGQGTYIGVHRCG